MGKSSKQKRAAKRTAAITRQKDEQQKLIESGVPIQTNKQMKKLFQKKNSEKTKLKKNEIIQKQEQFEQAELEKEQLEKLRIKQQEREQQQEEEEQEKKKFSFTITKMTPKVIKSEINKQNKNNNNNEQNTAIVSEEPEDQEIIQDKYQLDQSQRLYFEKLEHQINENQKNILIILQNARLSLFLNDVTIFNDLIAIFIKKAKSSTIIGLQVPADIEPNMKEIQNLLKSQTISRKQKINIIIQIDKIFFKMYYHNITKNSTSNFIINPLNFLHNSVSYQESERHFIRFLSKIEKSASKFMSAFEFTEEGYNMEEIFDEELEEEPEFYYYQNSLLQMLQMRIKETIMLFNNDDKLSQIDFIELAKNDVILGEDSEFDLGPRGPPIGYQLLQDWRDNCREWSCWLYSYSTLNKKSLKIIYDNLGNDIIEMGAGTGYISYLLKKNRKSLNIKAYDIHPTADKSGKNQYHRNAPSFFNVEQGDINILNNQEFDSYDMLLSYPPPKSTMALDCLKKFKGNKFAYVGEWRGVTATNQFEIFLYMNFKLVVQYKLPVYPDQNCDLTIWERRDIPLENFYENSEEVIGLQTIKCQKCELKIKQKQILYKCMFCRENYYCSQKCLDKDQNKHTNVHQIRAICNLDYDKLDIKNQKQFAPVNLIKVTKNIRSEVIKRKQEKTQNEDEEDADDYYERLMKQAKKQ